MNYIDLNCLNNSKSVCLIAHIDPDPDALSSMVVMRELILEKFNCSLVDLFADCESVSNNLIPILNGLEINQVSATYDTAIMMDSPNIDRLGKYSYLFTNAKTKIVIDHHATNTYCGDINIVQNCSSTCEIVYSIMKDFCFEISKENQGKLYAGLITDTNNFTVGNVTSTSFKMASEFSENINTQDIYNHFLANHNLKNMKLLALAINNIKAYCDDQIIISHISKDEANQLNSNFNDYYGIINHLATLNSAKLVCLIKPKDNSYYVGMRSRKNCGDVSKIAKAHGGGGHKGAAAFTSNDSISNIEKLILTEFKQQLSNYKPIKSNLF